MPRPLRAAAVAVLLGVAPATASSPPAYAERAAALLAGHVRDQGFSGSVLVAYEGRPIFRDSFGLANREWQIPNAADTRFRIASLSKQFTAAAILLLAERGLLSLDDPLSRHDDTVPAAWRAVTIRHLLSMRSGIPSYTSLPGFFGNPSRLDRSPAEVVDLVRDAPLLFPPGSAHDYSNTNYLLLGALIEKLGGQPYGAFLHDNIFVPLGMADTGYDDGSVLIARRASGYRNTAGQWTNAAYISMTAVQAAGGLYSTPADLLRWERALAAGKLLRPDSLAQMFRDHGQSYGLGWVVRAGSPGPVQAHSGDIPGYAAMICRYPADGLAIIVLSNLEGAPALGIAGELAGLYFAGRGQQRPACLNP
ncbi:MAG: serine hydrolase domain-containing protein [Thalassobaculales bacterium]